MEGRLVWVSGLLPIFFPVVVNFEIGGELQRVKNPEKISYFLLSPLLLGSNSRVGMGREEGDLAKGYFIYMLDPVKAIAVYVQKIPFVRNQLHLELSAQWKCYI